MHRLVDTPFGRPRTLGHAAPLFASPGNAALLRNAALAPEGPLSGLVLGGRYRIGAKIGEGGMNDVYAATDGRSGRGVAVKTPSPEKDNFEDSVRFLRREIKALSRVRHRNVVEALDSGAWEGREFLVMEYLDGEPLRGILDRNGPLPWICAMPIILQACEALEAVHAAAMVYGDLKPDNLFVVGEPARSPRVKMFDFGTVKFLDAPDGDELRAPLGSVLGSLHYLAPEQLERLDFGHGADIWAAGVTLYEMLAGRKPFESDDQASVLDAVMLCAPPPLARQGIPPAVELLVGKALEKDPARRFATAAEMKAAIEAL